jgi:hypothetical protein
MALIPLVMQKTTITIKEIKLSHTITLRFTRFPQCNVRPKVEAIMKKFTFKYGIQNSEEKINQSPKPQYTQISLSHKRDYYSLDE